MGFCCIIDSGGKPQLVGILCGCNFYTWGHIDSGGKPQLVMLLCACSVYKWGYMIDTLKSITVSARQMFSLACADCEEARRGLGGGDPV